MDHIDNGEGVFQGNAETSHASKNGDGMRNKIWTKAKHSKAGARTVLGDISDSKNSAKTTASITTSDTTTHVSSGFHRSSISAKGKMVVGDNRAPCLNQVTKHIDLWGKGQRLYKQNGVYIFGHQPPNIIGDHHGGTCASEIVVNLVEPPLQDGLTPTAGMNLSKSHMNDSHRIADNNAFNNLESMTLDC